MNISPISNNNISRTSSQAKVSFTSVIPFKVFIDGKPSTDAKNIRRAIRGLARILTTQDGGDEKCLALKKKFVSKDFNFCFPGGVLPNGKVIRNHVFEGISYIFTGFHSRKLDELGRKIGPEKRKGLENLGTMATHEVDVAVKDYFAKVKEFIFNPDERLRAGVNDKGQYVGDEIGLHILTESSGKPGKRSFKIRVDDIAFRRIINSPVPNTSVK